MKSDVKDDKEYESDKKYKVDKVNKDDKYDKYDKHENRRKDSVISDLISFTVSSVISVIHKNNVPLCFSF